MKQRRKTGLLLMLMAMLMLFSTNAFAAKAVCSIGKKNYSSLEQAVANVKKGQTIKLKKNITVNGRSLYLDRKIKYTINLNKHTLQVKNKQFPTLGKIRISKGDVTIKNGTLKTGVTVSAYEQVEKVKTVLTNVNLQNGLHVWESGTVTLNKVKYKSMDLERTTSIHNYGKITINGGTFVSKADWQIHNAEDGTMIINGGDFKVVSSEVEKLITNYGSLTVKKGNFDGLIESSFYLNIKGGTFKKTKGKIKDYSNAEYNTITDDGGLVQISGGKIYAPSYIKGEAAKKADIYAINQRFGYLEITGGKQYGDIARDGYPEY